ncbi:MAG: cation-transporting P-type ATPase, partial [Alistipes sp.]|nr:cation-transporting P-type ATPase [Alistipes sp.]
MYKKSNQSFIQECLDVKDQVVKDGKGRNVIPPPERESLWKLYLEKFKDPIIIVLIVAFALSLCLAFYEVVVMDYSWSVLFEPMGVLLALLL